MKGLFVKDMRLFLQQKRFFLLLLLLAVFLNFNSDGTFVIGYLTFVGSFFVLSTISYDENDNGFLFLMTLPIIRKTYVREKYLFGLLLGGCQWLIAVVIAFFFKLARESGFSVKELLLEAVLFIPILFVFIAVMLPIQFRFGVDKGRIVMLIVFGIIFLTVFLLMEAAETVGFDPVEQFNQLFAEHLGILITGIFALVIAGTVGSCVISSRIMAKKEF